MKLKALAGRWKRATVLQRIAAIAGAVMMSPLTLIIGILWLGYYCFRWANYIIDGGDRP